MKDKDIHRVIEILRSEVPKLETPFITFLAVRTRDPFKILISCILSMRTQDRTTAEASGRLYKLAETPRQMVKLSKEEIEKAIYPVGFYRVKVGNILSICKDLIEKYKGKVPDEIDELLKLKGVGRKTANLVVTVGYGKPGICVDTHIYRIPNRWGYIKTKTPEETEKVLRKKLPEEYWIEYNDLLVPFGQVICRPLSPKCSICPIEMHCEKVGVGIHR